MSKKYPHGWGRALELWNKVEQFRKEQEELKQRKKAEKKSQPSTKRKRKSHG